MTEEQTAARTLDDIRSGGVAMVSLVTQRIGELADKVAAGDFTGATTVAAEIHAKIKVLAYAQGQIGTLGKASVVRAEDIVEGMHLHAMGTATSVEVQQHICLGGDTHKLVTVSIDDDEDGQLVLDGDQEMLVDDTPPA